MGNWREISPHNIDEAPSASGLYCVYADRRLIYVGESQNIRTRFLTHQFSAAIHDGMWKGLRLRDIRVKVSLRDVPKKERLRLEKRLVKRAKPTLNWLGNGRSAVSTRLAFEGEMHLEYG